LSPGWLKTTAGGGGEPVSSSHPDPKGEDTTPHLFDPAGVTANRHGTGFWHSLCILGWHERFHSCEKELQRQDGCRKRSPQGKRAGREVCDEIPKVRGTTWTSSFCSDKKCERAGASGRGDRCRPRGSRHWSGTGLRLRLLPVRSLCVRALRLLGPGLLREWRLHRRRAVVPWLLGPSVLGPRLLGSSGICWPSWFRWPARV